ncbi:TIGR03790 family protein [Desulfogranum japonicum]|uniref:TIGR03790 family protein n=1 Tax=Desulfogranum japonicum TaxID=231447 RepID=UPI0003FBB41E|nr:TIGR03790 family protein [Desulfogranum japonicum]
MSHIFRHILLTCLVLSTPAAFALTADETVVIANRKADHSLDLAEYYMQQRSIPKENLIVIATTWEEKCSRSVYTEEIEKPVATAVKQLLQKKRVRCLVTVYGVPLKIDAPPLTTSETQELNLLEEKIDIIQDELKTAQKQHKAALQKEISRIQNKIQALKKSNTRAAVDSELSLVLIPDYPLDGWVPNPYFIGFQRKKSHIDKDNVLMVSRLDAPTPSIVRRIINDSIAIEQTGLTGTAYFDARWKRPDTLKQLSGYALYDASLHKAAQSLKEQKLPVILDEQSNLFPVDSCFSAALYCGWYSLSQYIDAFHWQKGAIGYHIASGECATLKHSHFEGWCKKMLEKGVAATIGPVYEPYVQAFPMPEIFFPVLHEGHLSLAETYLISLPYLSWQMVLIGDPLYRPFSRKN